MDIKEKKIEDPKYYTDIGKQLIARSAKITNETVEVRELSKEMNKDYMSLLIQTSLSGKDKYVGNYYVVVLTKRERLISTALRNFFFTRQTCPTPSYEQAVYVFNPKEEWLDFLWMIPSKYLCDKMYNQRHFIELRADPLLPFVVDFIEGNLLAKAMELNNE